MLLPLSPLNFDEVKTLTNEIFNYLSQIFTRKISNQH